MPELRSYITRLRSFLSIRDLAISHGSGFNAQLIRLIAAAVCSCRNRQLRQHASLTNLGRFDMISTRVTFCKVQPSHTLGSSKRTDDGVMDVLKSMINQYLVLQKAL